MTTTKLYSIKITSGSATKNGTWDATILNDGREATFMFNSERAMDIFSKAVVLLTTDDLPSTTVSDWQLADEWAIRVRQMVRTAEELADLVTRDMENNKNNNPDPEPEPDPEPTAPSPAPVAAAPAQLALPAGPTYLELPVAV